MSKSFCCQQDLGTKLDILRTIEESQKFQDMQVKEHFFELCDRLPIAESYNALCFKDFSELIQ